MGWVIIGYPILSDNVGCPEPFMVRSLYDDKFRTTDGHGFIYKDFVAEPPMARREGGMVLIHLKPGQWCFPPRT